MGWGSQGGIQWYQSPELMATEQKWNRGDQDGAVAAEESSPRAGGCLKERVGKKPLATDFHCQSRLSFSLTKHRQKPASLGKAVTGHQYHFDLTSGSTSTLASVSSWHAPSVLWALPCFMTQKIFQAHLVLSLLPSREIFLSLLWLRHIMQGAHPEKSSPYPLGPGISCFPRAREWGHESEGNSLGPFQTSSQPSRSGSCELSLIWSFISFNWKV